MNSNKHSHNFTFNNFKIEYLKFGDGNKLLLCFHGFGRPASDFLTLNKLLQDDFTVCSITLFFHGDTKIGNRDPETSPLLKAELKNIIEAFTEEMGYSSFFLMGYSLGGRVSLTLAELFPEKIEGVYLFAPDGIRPGLWYNFVSHSKAGQFVYRKFMRHNSLFFSIINGLKNTGLISKKMHKFLQINTSTKEKQQQAYDIWLFLRNIEPDWNTLKRIYKGRKTVFKAFFGEFDKIIPASQAKKLQKFLPQAEIHVLKTGHLLLSEKSASTIKEQNLLFR